MAPCHGGRSEDRSATADRREANVLVRWRSRCGGLVQEGVSRLSDWVSRCEAFILRVRTFIMGRTTVSLDEATQRIVDERSGDSGEYDSASGFVRECIRKYEDAEKLQAEVADLRTANEELREQRDDRNERISELESEVASLQDDLEEAQRDVERLQNEKREILAAREENQELRKYVEDERTSQQRWREAGLATRMKWRLFGMPSNSEA
jgi:Arc/MetJ-type ribon-helix-helix transcriptional regulator